MFVLALSSEEMSSVVCLSLALSSEEMSSVVCLS